nr:transmembrane channel-like protein 7 [Leptinotarsa decemlineata]
MSGGPNRKKTTRSQGWEEAGSEFYQESYPVDAEIEVLQRDPRKLATLLPSKQTRAAAATIRMRTNDFRTNNRTVRRHTGSRSRRESTVHRRTSVAGDVQVSMLPDLSEMRTNEETSWEEIMQIKAMPIPMSQKKEMKIRILNEPNLRLQGYEQFKWKRRKIWGQFESRMREFFQKTGLWKGSMKHIEGNFGTGVVAFFLFLKWLFILNLSIFIFIFLFITLPTILLDYDKCKNNPNTSYCCSEDHLNETVSENNILVDLVQGTGFLECTILFYGFYGNETVTYMSGQTPMYYNIPLAYIFIIPICFMISMIAIIRSAAKGFKERLIEGEGQFYHYCNLIFGGWDYCIDNEKSAKMKHKAIYSEIKASLETEKMKEEKLSRTTQEWYKIYFCRIVVNSVVVAVLAGCGCLVYILFEESTAQLNNQTDLSKFEQLFFQFLPSLSIVSLNMIIPVLFKFLISFEKYTPPAEIKYSLIRTVFIRLASLVVLYASLWREVGCKNCKVCWETFVGQQIYKLLLTDFAVHVFLTLIVNFLRSLLAKHIENKMVKFFCEQTFDLPRHALDIVYTQTLCWFGIFFAPLLSLLAAMIFFILFYIKKFACVVNCKPNNVIYRASKTNSMFMFVLLVSCIFVIFPLAYVSFKLEPSRNCGPFRDQTFVWDLVGNLFSYTPMWIQSIFYFFSTAGFGFLCFIVIVLILFYYRVVNSANRHLVEVLKNQLVLEGHDKQFLLDRLSLFIKQESQKRTRSEQNREGDINT